MINYNSTDNDIKEVFKNQLIKNAMSLGGKNRFLSLLEAIRASNPNILLSRDASFSSDKSLIKWKKVIYKDKIRLLMELIADCEINKNLMPEKNNSNYKAIKNLLRTIGPIKFEVKPKNNKDGDGFIFNFIDIVDKNTCRLTFMFEVMFILPIKLIKKIYNTPSNTIERNYKRNSKE